MSLASLIAEVEKLRTEAENWRAFHKARRAHIEALAASIRIKAFNDVLRALVGKAK